VNIVVHLELNFLKGETGFRACAAACAAADAPAGIGNLHKAFLGIADLDFIKSEDTLGASLETTATANTGIHIDACGEFRSPDLPVSG
jgi:hypothetical protein